MPPGCDAAAAVEGPLISVMGDVGEDVVLAVDEAAFSRACVCSSTAWLGAPLFL